VSRKPGFTFVDLFAGIGGFHAALSALGGECVYASEIDNEAAKVYENNWGIRPVGDITLLANDFVMDVPEHDVLVGGFPCQSFSKSGKQLGMEETRGTLFWNIAKIVEVRRPKMVLLENVRNLAGPRHEHEWNVIIETFRNLGYRISSEPLVLSPHRISPKFGGRPQIRERILIGATRCDCGADEFENVPPQLDLSGVTSEWHPSNWELKRDLPLELVKGVEKQRLQLAESELRWLTAWNDFVVSIKRELRGGSIPGFPLWVDAWRPRSALRIPKNTPKWKRDFLEKNSDFYTLHRSILDAWLRRWNDLEDFPPSRRKFEWQAQDAKDLWSTVLHFRPSGIRAKKPTYLPALVAITQTSIIGQLKRRISIREAARLQGFPEWFSFGDQRDVASYKQLGNAVNVGVVYNAMRALVERDRSLLKSNRKLVRAVLGASPNPDEYLKEHVWGAPRKSKLIRRWKAKKAFNLSK
jgi:DNA (cytosine-5)-methyltransferase 1